MVLKKKRIPFKVYISSLMVCLFIATLALNASGQQIKYEDRVGSNRDFDICEDFRFKRITRLVSEGKLSEQQGYKIWKREQSNKAAVTQVLGEAIEAKELTQDQVDRLLPLLDLPMRYADSRHGRFGQPKDLVKGHFRSGEVSAENRAAIYKRLSASNERGEIYDYDVASIMKQLYSGFDESKATIEEIAVYRGALNPRIAQSGSEARVLQMARSQRSQATGNRYEATTLKITKPSEWTKSLETQIFSGPQPGEKALPLTATSIRGEDAGTEFDPTVLAGEGLHMMLFVRESRTFGRFLGHLHRQLIAIEESSGQRWTMSILVCTDDANEAQKSFAILDERYPKSLSVGLCEGGAAGPPAYGIDKNLTATVIVVRDGIVTHNFAHSGNEFYAQPHFLGAIAEAMKIDHDQLRQFINDTPGDAAAAAMRRRKSEQR